jgi:hypothetical protein
MASTVKIKRHIGGTQTAPSGTSTVANEGELAVWFPGAAGGTATPTLYANDGGGWRIVNPPAAAPTVGTPTLNSATTGTKTGIGAAWNGFTPKPTDPIIIAAYNGGAYLKSGSGTNDGDWTSLGSATQFATAGDIHTGTDTTKAINSAVLRGEAINAPSTGSANAADADRMVRLGPTGELHKEFIPYLQVQTEDLTAQNAAVDIGAAWTASGKTVSTKDLVVAEWGNPKQSYILIDKTAPGNKGSWQSIGGSVPFATAAEVAAGTVANKAIDPAALMDPAVVIQAPTGGAGAVAGDAKKLIALDANGQIASAFLPPDPFATPAEIKGGSVTNKAIDPAGLHDATVSVAAPTGGTASNTDADKLLRLDSGGKVDAKFLPAQPTIFRGSVDATAGFAQPSTGGNYQTGDMVFSNAAGQIGAGWTGLTGNVAVGDVLVFDGTNWHLLENNTDLNAYLKLSGGTMADGGTITFDTTTATAGAGAATQVSLDGAGSSIDNFVIDCGGF